MAERYLIVSDLHLADVEERDDGWRYFKRARYSLDEDFAALLGRFRADGTAEDVRTLVLNGDVFDLDLVTTVPDAAPFEVSKLEGRVGLDPTPDKAAWKLERILDHHPLVVEALAGFVAQGGRIVHVLGNHDRELVFGRVRAVLLDRLEGDARGRGLDFDRRLVRVEPWFHHVPGTLYAEHGNQYDEYNAYDNVLDPVVLVHGQPQLVQPMGNLSNRCILSTLGTFNPFSGDYLHGFWGYFDHWREHYKPRHRAFIAPYLAGSRVVLLRLARTFLKEVRRPSLEDSLSEHACRTEASEEQLRSLAALQSRPVYRKPFKVLRDLWYDRVVGFAVMIGAAVAMTLVSLPLWLELLLPVLAVLAYVSYELWFRPSTKMDVKERIPTVAATIAELMDVPLVALSHDHLPRRQRLDGGATLIDTGTWAPITEGGLDGTLCAGYRNYVLLVSGGGRDALHFGSWLDQQRGRARRDLGRRAPPSWAPDVRPAPEPCSLLGADASPAPPTPAARPSRP